MNKLVSLAILVVYLVNLGCQSMREVPVSEAHSATDRIAAVIYPSGEVVEFNEAGGVINSYTKTIDGTTKAGAKVSIPVDDTLYVRVRRTNKSNSVIAGVGLGVVVASVIAVAVFFIWVAPNITNCPYVYSFDGKEYVFDAQPLGSAISKGLERSDLARLEHLRPVDGAYRLLVRNEELRETQYLDEVKLLVADHPANTRVVLDANGTLHVIGDVVTPSHVTDEAGSDIHRFFDAPDEVAWQTKMPIDDSWRSLPRRHELTFEFPRPRDATSAEVVVKAGASLWGSEMIHRMLELRGEGIDEWYQSIDSNGAAMDEFVAFDSREELYSLKLYVLVGDQWVRRGLIASGASLVTEERVIPVDLTGVTGDIIKMQVRPPRGFWSLDFMGLEFAHHPSPDVIVVQLEQAIARDQTDVTAVMSAVDENRYVMPRFGDEVALEFVAPETPVLGNRTVFLDTRGYDLAHIDKAQPEQANLIADLMSHDGQIVDYSLDLYMKLRTELLSRR
jgi:hypothetical protein